MNKMTALLGLVGLIQIVLGVMYLFAPAFMLQSMGHSVPAADLHYPLAMLASRFIAYGVLFLIIARAAAKHRLWIFGMVLIQAIDLAAGVFYTATGVVPLSLSGFPLFNATWILLLLLWWMPKAQPEAVRNH